MEDEVIRGATIIKQGEITWPPPAPKLSAVPAKPAEPQPVVVVEAKKPLLPAPVKAALPAIIGALALLGLGSVAPPSFMAHFTVFVLACFCRLYGDLERHGGLAYPADEFDQCHQQHHRTRRLNPNLSARVFSLRYCPGWRY